MQKNLADISYTSQVMANFSPNFVVMAMGVDRGREMRLAAFDGPLTKTSLGPIDAPISQKFLTQAEL